MAVGCPHELYRTLECWEQLTTEVLCSLLPQPHVLWSLFPGCSAVAAVVLLGWSWTPRWARLLLMALRPSRALKLLSLDSLPFRLGTVDGPASSAPAPSTETPSAPGWLHVSRIADVASSLVPATFLSSSLRQILQGGAPSHAMAEQSTQHRSLPGRDARAVQPKDKDRAQAIGPDGTPCLLLPASTASAPLRESSSSPASRTSHSSAEAPLSAAGPCSRLRPRACGEEATSSCAERAVGLATGLTSSPATEHPECLQERKRCADGQRCTHSSVVSQDDLRTFLWQLESKEASSQGGDEPAWTPLMEKKTSNLGYVAWRRDPQEGPTEYWNRTVLSDCSSETMRDFFWEDDFRPEWDSMLLEWKTLEECEDSGLQIVRWVRKFPFFCKDREYIIARRIWAQGSTFFCITKCLAHHPSAPQKDKPRRVEWYSSSWRIRPLANGACEMLAYHQEDLGIQRHVAKMAVRQGLWGGVKKMEQGVRAFQRFHSQLQHQQQHRALASPRRPVPMLCLPATVLQSLTRQALEGSRLVSGLGLLIQEQQHQQQAVGGTNRKSIHLLGDLCPIETSSSLLQHNTRGHLLLGNSSGKEISEETPGEHRAGEQEVSGMEQGTGFSSSHQEKSGEQSIVSDGSQSKQQESEAQWEVMSKDTCLDLNQSNGGSEVQQTDRQQPNTKRLLFAAAATAVACCCGMEAGVLLKLAMVVGVRHAVSSCRKP